jgi:GTP-binding protein LepA
VDKIKSITHGYGSFEYEYGEFERSDIVKVVIHIMNDPVDALTFLVHEKKAYEYSKSICQKIKETIPPHLFLVSIQARVGTKTIAKEDVPHIKKNVTAKCYGGDYSRKKKLLDRYKEGKKKLRSIGKVQVGKDTFLHVMKQ